MTFASSAYRGPLIALGAAALLLSGCSSLGGQDVAQNTAILTDQLKDAQDAATLSFSGLYEGEIVDYAIVCPPTTAVEAANIYGYPQIKDLPKGGPKEDQAALVFRHKDNATTVKLVDTTDLDLCAYVSPVVIPDFAELAVEQNPLTEKWEISGQFLESIQHLNELPPSSEEAPNSEEAPANEQAPASEQAPATETK